MILVLTSQKMELKIRLLLRHKQVLLQLRVMMKKRLRETVKSRRKRKTRRKRRRVELVLRSMLQENRITQVYECLEAGDQVSSSRPVLQQFQSHSNLRRARSLLERSWNMEETSIDTVSQMQSCAPRRNLWSLTMTVSVGLLKFIDKFANMPKKSSNLA